MGILIVGGAFQEGLVWRDQQRSLRDTVSFFVESFPVFFSDRWIIPVQPIVVSTVFRVRHWFSDFVFSIKIIFLFSIIF
jgi:hypothetical protein